MFLTCRRKLIRTNLAGFIYERLYNARNAFLHGNPVTIETLKLEKSGGQVQWFAAPLFRLALTAFLDLRFSETLAKTADDHDWERHEVRGRIFRLAQRRSEDAMLGR